MILSFSMQFSPPDKNIGIFRDWSQTTVDWGILWGGHHALGKSVFCKLQAELRELRNVHWWTFLSLMSSGMFLVMLLKLLLTLSSMSCVSFTRECILLFDLWEQASS
jgi:hypothetical protein